jgi:hypothetical protein
MKNYIIVVVAVGGGGGFSVTELSLHFVTESKNVCKRIYY